jgi:DNA-binding IclR family transcriptional regulator
MPSRDHAPTVACRLHEQLADCPGVYSATQLAELLAVNLTTVRKSLDVLREAGQLIESPAYFRRSLLGQHLAVVGGAPPTSGEVVPVRGSP